MFDNMSSEMMREAVKIVSQKVFIEASGNMSLDKIKKLPDCGVAPISFGELTHSVRAFDFSLKKDLIYNKSNLSLIKVNNTLKINT